MITVVTQPAEEPITLTEAKLHLRVDVDADDALILSQITAARMWCEKFTRRAFVTQTLEMALDVWPTCNLELWRPPLQSVSSVTYTDEDGAATVMSTDDYEVDTRQGRIGFETLPSATLRSMSGIVIQYVAGYGGEEDVPEIIKQAIKLLIGDYYYYRENRAAEKTIDTVERILWPVRSWRRYT